MNPALHSEPYTDIGESTYAPITTIVITKADDSDQRCVEALLDSGATISVIPESVKNELSLIRMGVVPTRTYEDTEGEERDRDLYYVGVGIFGINVGIQRVVTTRNTRGFVGRNVLEAFVLTLSGPTKSYEVNR